MYCDCVIGQGDFSERQKYHKSDPGIKSFIICSSSLREPLCFLKANSERLQHESAVGVAERCEEAISFKSSSPGATDETRELQVLDMMGQVVHLKRCGHSGRHHPEHV